MAVAPYIRAAGVSPVLDVDIHLVVEITEDLQVAFRWSNPILGESGTVVVVEAMTRNGPETLVDELYPLLNNHVEEIVVGGIRAVLDRKLAAGEGTSGYACEYCEIAYAGEPMPVLTCPSCEHVFAADDSSNGSICPSCEDAVGVDHGEYECLSCNETDVTRTTVIKIDGEWVDAERYGKDE